MNKLSIEKKIDVLRDFGKRLVVIATVVEKIKINLDNNMKINY